jgi:SAM-dependent methyltransferase
MDPLAEFKEKQKRAWAHFAPLEALTTPGAARLVGFARIKAGQRVLDVGCGTGVVAVTAALRGARVTGLDLTPELLERARENSQIAGVEVAWHEGDVEALPFPDGSFDVVVSQFGHMFAPRPEVAVAEMLRVLAPGGTLAFATWPPDLLMGRASALIAGYAPPPPPGMALPMLWGDPNIVRERLGNAVRDLTFDRERLLAPCLSVKHFRVMAEKSAGPMIMLVKSLQANDPARLEQFRNEYDALVAEYATDNIVRQDFMLTRAIKV